MRASRASDTESEGAAEDAEKTTEEAVRAAAADARDALNAAEAGEGAVREVRNTPPAARCAHAGTGGDSLPSRVLVVDDSPVNRKVLAAFLKKAGVVRIGQACDGAEALAALGAAFKSGDPYDLVLSDFWMPVMNGLELVEKLRADPDFAALPVVAVTADTECRKDPRSSLFDEILLKPVAFDKLSKVLAGQQ